jgi:hypothetical protein
VTPVPLPTEPDRRCDRYWRATINGRLQDYKVCIVETVAQREAVTSTRWLRGRMRRIAGYVAKPVEVEVCPLDWQPDPIWCAAINQHYETWATGMETLQKRLSGLTEVSNSHFRF